MMYNAKANGAPNIASLSASVVCRSLLLHILTNCVSLSYVGSNS